MTSAPLPPVLDTTGLRCPLPVLKARKALAELGSGAVLEVLASDPAAPEDFRALCLATGHQLISHRHEGDIHRFLIEVSARSGRPASE